MSVYQTFPTDRALLAISGDDRVDFLQNLLTQDMTTCAPHICRAAALLTPQGKLAFDLLIFCRPDSMLLDCAAEQCDMLTKKLQIYKLRAKIDITRLDAHLVLVWCDDNTACPDYDGLCADPRHSALGMRGWFATRPDYDLPIASSAAWHTHRIAHGVPEGAGEMPSGQIFPLEFGFEQMGAIDFQKGCFIGQEVTSRVHRKGQLRKSLHPIDFTATAPARGTPITIAASGKHAGEIIAAADTHALALIRNDALAHPLCAAGQAFTLPKEEQKGLFAATLA